MVAIMNYNGRGDVSSARANVALGAIINVTCTYNYTLFFCAIHAEKQSFVSLRSNRDQSC